MFDIQYKLSALNNQRFLAVDAREFEKFSPPLISKQTAPAKFDALVAFFDLEGFTSFCNRADAYLFVEAFLNSFENWVFAELRNEFIRSENDSMRNEIILWEHLPIFWKPTGDGGFFIWNLHLPDFVGDESVGNIVVRCQHLVHRYASEFFPNIRKEVSDPPPKLRCGIARGEVISIRNGADYVGACINCAARLQKIKALPFAILRSGIDPQKCFDQEHRSTFIGKRIRIRGIHQEENILLDKRDWDLLRDEDKVDLVDP